MKFKYPFTSFIDNIISRLAETLLLFFKLFHKKKLKIELADNTKYKLTVIIKGSKKFDFWAQAHIESNVMAYYDFF